MSKNLEIFSLDIFRQFLKYPQDIDIDIDNDKKVAEILLWRSDNIDIDKIILRIWMIINTVKIMKTSKMMKMTMMSVSQSLLFRALLIYQRNLLKQKVTFTKKNG